MMILRRTGAADAAQELVHPPDLDPTYRYSASDLERCVPPEKEQEPSDFDAFWTELAGRARAVDPEQRVTGWRRWRYPGGLPKGDYELADLEFTSIGGIRIGGWVVRPVDGANQIAVCGHGYAGRSAPSCDDDAPSALWRLSHRAGASGSFTCAGHRSRVRDRPITRSGELSRRGRTRSSPPQPTTSSRRQPH